MASEQGQNSASMLHGHVQYAQGAVSEALGYESGKQTKEAAVQEMRQAKEQQEGAGEPVKSSVLGEAESVLGKMTGCEGMQEEAQERKV